MALNFLNVLGASGKIGAGMRQAEAASRAAQEEEIRLAGVRQEQRERGRMTALQQTLAEQATTSPQFAPIEAQSPTLIGRRAGVAAPQPMTPEQPPVTAQPTAGLATAPKAAAPAPAAAGLATAPAAPALPTATAAPAAPAAPQDRYGPELQQALAMREQQVAQYNDLANLSRMYQMTGTAQGLEAAAALQQRMGELRTGINQLDGNMFYLQGRQGLAEFSDLGDSTRLEAVLGEYVGAPVSIRPRGDDKFDVYVGGKLQSQNADLSMDEVAGLARSYFDTDYVSMMGQRAQKEYEAQIDLRKLMAVEGRKDARAILDRISARDVAQIKADNDTKDLKFSQDAVGNAYVTAGNSLYRVAPESTITTSTGETFKTMPGLELIGTVP